MYGAPRPLRIVRTYYTPTHGTGDPPIRVDEDGTHWRAATSYETSGTQTCSGTTATIRDGWVFR